MQRGNLLKKIGVAGLATRFSATAQADDVTLETREPHASTIESYLDSEPVENISEKVGPRFNVQSEKKASSQINVEGQPKESRVLADTEEPIIHTVRLETNVGVLGLTLRNNEVVRAILAFDKNVGVGWVRRITNAETVSRQHQMVIGTTNEAIYARATTEEENAEIQRYISNQIQEAFLVEKDTNVYYKVKTGSELITIKKEDGKIIQRKSLVAGSTDSDSNGDVTISADSCQENGTYTACAYDLINTSAYCTLAGYACTLTGITGPQSFIACLAAITSLCGGQLVLFTISGACEDAARCIKNFCEQNDCSITTPIVPTP